MTRSVSFGLIFAAIVVVALLLGFCSNTKNSTDTAGSSQDTKSASTVATESVTTSAAPEPATAPSAESSGDQGTSSSTSAAVDTGATGGAADDAAASTTASNVATEAPAAVSAASSADSAATTAAANAAATETAVPTEIAASTADSETAANTTAAATSAVAENKTEDSTAAIGEATNIVPVQSPSDAGGSDASTAAAETAEAGDASAPPTQPAVEDASGAQSPSISVVTVAPAETQQAALPPAESGNEEGEVATPSVAELVRPSFDVVRVDPDGNLVLAGRGMPGDEIVVTSNGQVVGTAKADGNGEWVIVPTAPLAPGNHQLALTQKQADGKVIDADKMVMVAVPEKGKDVAGATATEDSGSLVVMVPGDDSGGAVVLQNPTEESQKPAETVAADADGIASGALVLDAVDYDDKGDVTIGGRGTVNATIQVYLDNRLIGTSTVDAAGRWQVTPTSPVEPRLHTLRVDQIAPDGKVAARVESPFLRAERIDLPADQAFIVQPGNSLWRIARRTYGEGVRYTTIFQANREQIRDPDLIYPGQVFSIPPQAQTN